nr:MAG TPA: hypothetical protein [Caudoviricetes sp.]
MRNFFYIMHQNLEQYTVQKPLLPLLPLSPGGIIKISVPKKNEHERENCV